MFLYSNFMVNLSNNKSENPRKHLSKISFSRYIKSTDATNKARLNGLYLASNISTVSLSMVFPKEMIKGVKKNSVLQ